MTRRATGATAPSTPSRWSRSERWQGPVSRSPASRSCSTPILSSSPQPSLRSTAAWRNGPTSSCKAESGLPSSVQATGCCLRTGRRLPRPAGPVRLGPAHHTDGAQHLNPAPDGLAARGRRLDRRQARRDRGSRFRAIYLEYDAAFDWSPDDPRLRALADRTRRWLADRHGRFDSSEWPVQDPAIAQLVATSVSASSPAWDRLAEIAEEQAAGE